MSSSYRTKQGIPEYKCFASQHIRNTCILSMNEWS